MRVVALTAGLAVFTAASLAGGDAPFSGPGGPLVVVLVAFGFLLAERFVFNVEYRHHAVSFSLSEVPTAFALVFLDPVSAVLARVVGSLIAVLLRSRRLDAQKLTFNMVLFATEIAFAFLLLTAATSALGANEALTIALVVPSVFLASVLGGLLVSLVVSWHEGGLWGRLRLEAAQGWPVYLLGSVLGATAVAPAALDPRLAWLPVLSVVMVWRLYVAYGAITQRHRDVEALYEFTSAIGRSHELDGMVRTAQAESRRLLRAEQAGLVVFGADGSVVASSWPFPGAMPIHSVDPSWRWVFEADEPVVRSSSVERRRDATDLAIPWTEALLAPVRDSDGTMALLLVADRTGLLKRFSSDDVSRMRSLADQLAVSLRKGLLHIRLEHEATHDRLTGLPNRALLERSITGSLARRQPVAVFLLDLDRFKEVNDGLGHHVGDVLLQKFADRVGSIVGPGAVVSRLAGDEFAIMASGMTRHQAGELGSRILAAARDPFDLGELSVAVSCSIGLAIGPAHGEDATTLLRRADLAMYEAKGRSGGVSLYREDLETTSTQRLRLLQDLRVAAVDEQMQAWFQPKIHLRTNAVVGVETLVRWHHPDQGVLEAERFIGLAEQTDLIHTITDRMLTSALVAARSWRRRGWSLGVAVNVSARSLLDELLADRIARHLHQHDVPAEMLTIEITETSVMADVSRALVTLDRLSALGVQLSVDDYGTGYSSLTYLRKLPVSELKIDRGFIANMLTDEHDEVIVRSTIDLGRHLGLRVVAEGIESEEVASRLRDLGCDIGQGSGFAAPLPAAELECWLAASPYVVPGADGDTEALATA